MSTHNRCAVAYALPCGVETDEPYAKNIQYVLVDANRTVMTTCGNLVLATTIRDALNRPYYEALEAAKARQELAAYEWGLARAPGLDAGIRAQAAASAAKHYRDAREIMGIYEA